MRRIPWSPALTIAAVLLSAPVAAKSPVDAAKAWGLVGTWSLDCSKPPSQQNGHLSFRVGAKGQLLHKREFGDSRDENSVTEARVLPDGSLEVVIDFKSLTPPHKRRLVFAKVGEGRKRAMENQVVGSPDFSVKDGKLLVTGNPTPVQIRCGGQQV